MKKIIVFLLFLSVSIFLVSCEAPYQITETIIKDSTGKEIHTIIKKYENGTTTVVPQASFNFVTHPGWDSFYGTPYYYGTPFYNYSPRVVIVPKVTVPHHPIPHYYRIH
jgi:hypothetical protein